MADQFNDSIPAVTNQITEDVADIAESLGYLKDCFQKILGGTWSNTDTTGFKLLTTVGFSDGTYAYTFPTQPAAGIAAAKFMLGTSSTIIWMYLNTAPPGWKALSTGADMVLGVAGGAAAYNVNGGNPDSVATWTISGLTADSHTHTGAAHTHTGPSHTHTGPSHTHTGPSHTHTGPSHTHTINTTTNGFAVDPGTNALTSATAANGGTGNTGAEGTGATGAEGTGATGADGTGNTGSTAPGASAAASANGVSASGAWRPKASVGKLFQLDTA